LFVKWSYNKKDIQKLLATEQLSFNIKEEKETFEKDNIYQ